MSAEVLARLLSDAPRIPVGSLCALQNGRAFKPNEWSDAGRPIVRIQNLNDAAKPFNYFVGELPERYQVRSGDVLLSWSGTPGTSFGCFRWKGPDGWLNQHIFNVRLDPERVLPDFFVFHVNAILDELIGKAHGAVGLRHITRAQLDRVELRIPSLKAQRRVVDLLSRAENIARMRREAGRKAREVIPALFVDMFTGGNDARNGRGEGRREADPMVRLGDAANVVSGVAKGRKLVGKVTREVPYLRVANVQAGGLDMSEMKYIPATQGEIEELAVHAGDVLLTEGGDLDKVGRGALLETDIGECIHQNHVFRVRAHPAKLVPEYFAAFLQTFAARQYFLKAAKKTSNLASINMTQLKNLPLPLPNLELQAEFQARFRACRSLVGQQAKATSIAETSFQSLLAGTFGEERI
jgi:type I restriction enzyme S subunit